RCLRSDAFTHAVFTTMEECPHFQDLTVKRFLKTLLEHNRRDILSKPEKFVRLSTFLQKVDAVLPVLSPQLLRQIQNRDFSRESEWEKRYNRFAHSMMLDQHVEYGSKNGFCRAVCPARFPEESQGVMLLRPSLSIQRDPQVLVVESCLDSVPVDAVLPVLSPQLLRQIQNRDFSRESEWEKRYNCFAHSMMLDQHVEYGSKNGFCRAVCPARFPEEVGDASTCMSFLYFV
ncbi:hypothetical protein O3P69_011287, partial [Scylla paramamosain]